MDAPFLGKYKYGETTLSRARLSALKFLLDDIR